MGAKEDTSLACARGPTRVHHELIAPGSSEWGWGGGVLGLTALVRADAPQSRHKHDELGGALSKQLG